MPFTFHTVGLEDVVIAEPEIFDDSRGRLLETYEQQSFESGGIDNDFCLDLYSQSNKHVLRGLHFQTEPFQQAKLIQCVSGKIFDVAVDIRPESETFSEYVSVSLDEEQKRILYIPRGFAHGYLTLEEETVVMYKMDNQYSPEHESGVHWRDPEIDIEWPCIDPIVSESDSKLPTLSELNRKTNIE